MKAGKKILVIDDLEMNRLLIQTILKISLPDYNILLASSGAEGLEMARTELPEAILLDILMPEMDGFETCRKIKSLKATGNIPILLISAIGYNPEVRVKGFQSGADAIMSKPFDKEEFIAIVNVMLRIKKAEDRLKRQNQELGMNLEKIQDYQEKLKKLNALSSIAIEKERRRIAEYLHDGIGQTLSLVNIKLTSLLIDEQLPKTEKKIRESVALINDAINETRILTYELSPPILYELGLVAAIKWRLEKIESNNEIDTKLIIASILPRLSNDLDILLFRIVNELIANSIKHAKTKYLEIEFRDEDDQLCISVLDSGKGFIYKRGHKFSEEGGFGLFNISERLDSIQGSLHFESEKERGTKAIIRIPLLRLNVCQSE